MWRIKTNGVSSAVDDNNFNNNNTILSHFLVSERDDCGNSKRVCIYPVA